MGIDSWMTKTPMATADESIPAKLRAMTRLLKFEEVQDLLSIEDKQTLYEMIWAGEIPATKVRSLPHFCGIIVCAR